MSTHQLKFSYLSYLNGLLIGLLICLPVLRIIVGLSQYYYYIVMLLIIAYAIYLNLRQRSLYIKKYIGIYLFLTNILFLWLVTSIMWTSVSITNSIDNLLLALGILGLNYALCFSSSKLVIQSLLQFISLAGLGVAIYVINTYISAGSLFGYNTILADSYLVFSHFLGIASVNSGLQVLVAKKWSWIKLSIVLITLIGLSLSIARGALLFTIISIMFLGSYAVINNSNQKRIVILRRAINPKSNSDFGKKIRLAMVVITPILMIYGALQVTRFSSKIGALLSGGDQSILTRLELYIRAINTIGEAPLIGHGIGSSGELLNASSNVYPHNIILEVGLEGGIIASLLMLALLFLPLYAIIKKMFSSDKSLEWIPVSGIYIFVALEYMKSFSFYSSRTLFIFSILSLWMINATSNSKSKLNPNSLKPRKNLYSK